MFLFLIFHRVCILFRFEWIITMVKVHHRMSFSLLSGNWTLVSKHKRRLWWTPKLVRLSYTSSLASWEAFMSLCAFAKLSLYPDTYFGHVNSFSSWSTNVSAAFGLWKIGLTSSQMRVWLNKGSTLSYLAAHIRTVYIMNHFLRMGHLPLQQTLCSIGIM